MGRTSSFSHPNSKHFQKNDVDIAFCAVAGPKPKSEFMATEHKHAGNWLTILS